jgi:TrmH family RNA methyltransferase
MPTQPLSPNNPRIRDAAKLRQKKFRRETGRILVEGARAVADAANAGARVVEVFATAERTVRGDSGDTTQNASGVRGTSTGPAVSSGSFTLISEAAAAKLAETRAPQGVFAVVDYRTRRFAELPETGPEPCMPLVLVADGLADPGNLGTMIRSAAALGATAVIATGDACDVLNPKAVRATMGALFRVPVAEEPSVDGLISELRRRGIAIAATVAGGGEPPWSVNLSGPLALLIGSEAEGLSPETATEADLRITIPMHGGTESLNAAASAAAVLYEAARQRAGRA